MQAQLQKIGDTIGFVLRPEDAEELHLAEGDMVEITRAAAPALTYATTEEALAAYKQTEPQYADVYRELAK